MNDLSSLTISIDRNRRALSEVAPVGLETVAEGIEQADQIAHLSQMRCTLGQGYYFSKPITATRLSALLGPGATSQPETHVSARSA